MERSTILKLRDKAKAIEPVIRVGKKGLTDEQIEEIKTILKKRKLIKIKLLKTSPESADPKAAAKALAEKTGSTLIDVVGHVIVLHKR